MKKRIISMLLCICVLFQFPVITYAENGSGATITGVSITVDGVTYTQGNVLITPESTVTYTITGNNFADLDKDNYLYLANGVSDYVSPDFGWEVDPDANTAVETYGTFRFEQCDDFCVRYSNDGGKTKLDTGLYLTYRRSVEHAAQITGVSIMVDGVYYTQGSVTITPTSEVFIYVTGNNFENLDAGNRVDYAPNVSDSLTSEGWMVDTVDDTAIKVVNGQVFAGCAGDQIGYTNDGGYSGTGVDILLTYGEKALITDISITVDGRTYTEGAVTITPESVVFVTVSGSNFDKLDEDHSAFFSYKGYREITAANGWMINTANNTAIRVVPSDEFVGCEDVRMGYSNDHRKNSTESDIYLTYDDGLTEETRAKITGVSIIVDGVHYTQGRVIITPSSVVQIHVIGTNFENLGAAHWVDYAPGVSDRLTSEGWIVDTVNDTATKEVSGEVFVGCNFEQIAYTDQGGFSGTGVDILVSYVEKALITGVSITVDGVHYTQGNVKITPNSTAVIHVRGINFSALGPENWVDYAPGLSDSLTSAGWIVDRVNNTAYKKVDGTLFAGSRDDQIGYTNDGGFSGTGVDIMLNYEAEHLYDDGCDAQCNGCGALREAPHEGKPACIDRCSSCGAENLPVTAAHSYVNGICISCGAAEEQDELKNKHGDSNSDGRINGLDLILLRQYLAGWDVTCDLTAADTNGNGTVNGLDLILLRQYLAGWDVTLGPRAA